MAVKIAEELVQEFPKVAEYSDELVERNLSLVRLLEPDQAEQSAKTLLRNLTLTTSPWRLRKTYIELGSLMLRQKRYVEAEEAFRKAADLQDPCAAERPSDHGQQLYTGIALRGLGDVLAGSARLKEAAEIYARVTQVFDKLAADFPGMVFYRPQQSFSHCRQAEVLDKLGRTDDAERAYRKAFEIEAKAAADFPALSQFREKAWSRCLGLGQFLTKIGQVEAAQEVYAQAPALLEKLEAAPPTRLKHWQGLARTQSKLGEALATKGNAKKAEAAFQDAEAIQDKVDSESPANEGRGELARSQSDAARLLVQAGWLEEGERLGRRALANAKAFAVQSPSRAESRANMARRNQWLGDCLLKLGRFPEAAAEFQQAAAEYAKAADNEPANAELRKQRASIQADLGHIDELIAQTQVIDRNRNSWQAWYRRGNAWLKLRQWEKAIADQTKALELKPDHVWSWYQRAFAYRHLSQLEKALADATKAVELEPQAWGPHSERAHVLIELGRWEQAVVELTSALELNPGSWSTWHRRGQAYRVLGQWDKAAADYAKVLEGEPHSGQAHNDLAHLLAACPDPKSRNPKRAVELARRAVGLTPQEGVYWNTLGIALYRTGNWNAAVKALEKSMKLRQGGDSLDWFFLAMAHWQLGDKGQAREWHDQAVQWLEKNKPQDEELRRFHSEAAELLEVKEESGR
jgi:tetratricopeptide (TPR) repeat protein